MTHPSLDPPRIGFLSQVPTNASALLTEAVEDAKDNGGNFESALVFLLSSPPPLYLVPRSCTFVKIFI